MIAINENDTVQQTQMVSSYFVFFFSSFASFASSSFLQPAKQVYTTHIHRIYSMAHNNLNYTVHSISFKILAWRIPSMLAKCYIYVMHLNDNVSRVCDIHDTLVDSLRSPRETHTQHTERDRELEVSITIIFVFMNKMNNFVI